MDTKRKATFTTRLRNNLALLRKFFGWPSYRIFAIGWAGVAAMLYGTSVLAWDEQCVIPDYAKGPSYFGPVYHIYYGTLHVSTNEWGAQTLPKQDVLLVCGGVIGKPLQRLCEITLHDGIEIAILANDYNNVIRPAPKARCDNFNWNKPRGRWIFTQREWIGPPIFQGKISEFHIQGNGGNDYITGIQDQNTTNIIYGDFAGHYITAPEGFDVLSGGPGNDNIYGEGLDDIIFGNEGDDILVGGYFNGCSESSQHDDDLIFGGGGRDHIFGDAGPDEMCGDPLCGNGVDPEATSTDDPTPKHSGLYLGGDDMLIGGEGNDNIAGGPGNDGIVGDSDYQRLDTKDVLCGGPGRDFFRTDFPDLVFYELDGEPNINDYIYDFSNVEPGLSECAWDSFCPSLLP